MDQNQFMKALNEKGINVSEEQLHSFQLYFEHLVSYNEKVNLTAITKKDEVYLKHFYDSLTILTNVNLKDHARLCDVGAGAGFPSVPLKIMRPDIDITIVDSLGKRIDFLNSLYKELNLVGIKAVHSRAEDFSLEHRESFDYVTARAVARLNVLAELCIPLVKLGGAFISMKGTTGFEELQEANNSIKTLGCIQKELIHFSLPEEGGERNIIVFEKVKQTPLKYPRNYGQIKKKPL
jgi:16S rRNA (guanine527-N7)-methyltransferase